MTYRPKIVAFAGSLRKDSYNKKMVKIAIAGAEEAGASVTYIDLKDYPLPIFDQDLENAEGLPENAKKIKQILKEHDGFLIASPEYNSSMTAAFKNFIDWASRPVPNEKPLECFYHKAVLLMSASPGNLGGLRGLVHVRSLLGNINCLLLPQQKCIPAAHEAFDEAGNLRDPKLQHEVQHLGHTLADFLKKLLAEHKEPAHL